MTESGSRAAERGRRGVALAGLLAAAGALHAEPVAPPLTIGSVEAAHMAFCMSPEQVDALAATMAGGLLGTGADDSIKLLMRSMSKSVRDTGDRITAEAIAGDAGARAVFTRFLGECLLAGIPTAAQRRERALGWLREDAAGGTADAADTLAALVALGDLPGGASEVQRLLAARPSQAPAGAKTEAAVQSEAAQQHLALASALLRGAMSTFSSELGVNASDGTQLRFLYRPCPGSFESSAAQAAAPPQRAAGLARVTARLAQLPRTGLDCTDRALAAVVLPLSFTAPARPEPARR
ncbi:hypothetical protein JR064_05110 [Xanthomonas sp. CFBP 8703]|uniref:Uncharacterized protein n=1 Tax=Xanthomonas bonasiae TaxID=2810351 RepID=A0ABS3AYV8_9XANT|nr:hypothetical protein [Xanthomonas bonasiae]MBN6101539.1 hypothetical protein [Xanthomonas bonasiae]